LFVVAVGVALSVRGVAAGVLLYLGPSRPVDEVGDGTSIVEILPRKAPPRLVVRRGEEACVALPVPITVTDFVEILLRVCPSRLGVRRGEGACVTLPIPIAVVVLVVVLEVHGVFLRCYAL
jgi:hypothetical protein